MRNIFIFLLLIGILLLATFIGSFIGGDKSHEIGAWVEISWSPTVFEENDDIIIKFRSLGNIDLPGYNATEVLKDPPKIGGFSLFVKGDPGSPYFRDYDVDEIVPPGEWRIITIPMDWDTNADNSIDVSIEIFAHNRTKYPSEKFEFEIRLEKEVTPFEILTWSIIFGLPTVFIVLIEVIRGFLNNRFLENIRYPLVPKYAFLFLYQKVSRSGKRKKTKSKKTHEREEKKASSQDKT